MNRYIGAVLSTALLCLSQATPARAWGALGHAIIGQLAEDDLRKNAAQLLTLLRRFREPTHYHQVSNALLGTEPPEPGTALRTLANWPDVHKRQPGMLPADDQRHYINLPFTASYNRTQYCADGVCSLETLLEQRAILANRQAPLSKRAVALAWVAHLIGDIHQPLHAGKAEDRGGNLICVAWQGEPSRLVVNDGKPGCTGANLHAVWDSKLIEAAAGFVHPDDATAFAQQLRPLWQRVQAAEPPLTARIPAEWRAVVERWHNETHDLILRAGIYPPDGQSGSAYLQRHYPTARLQLLRAAVRLAALLRQSLQP